ncbi:hypothetical protein Cgig2_025997 [Carnegiea gigantea]|uniref:4-hydroxy-4-methyl-2-oxoglutarate aldolase n=1 Tax=Carnegiea gigantea TaxID=171969 RepID=A0A9Q1JGN2_9CARY|nr:hypothetical protein Cgig2_025997 [Carnegiea gigantea]
MFMMQMHLYFQQANYEPFCLSSINGHVVILKTFEDNALAIDTILEAKAQGVPLGRTKVLVIDGGGSLGRSMVAVGIVFAQMALKMVWAGIVVNGCVRDFDEINSIDAGIRALGLSRSGTPRKGWEWIEVSENRVNELDVNNRSIKYTSIHFKMAGYYRAKREVMTTEDDLKVHQEGLQEMHKAIQEFVLLYPNLLLN